MYPGQAWNIKKTLSIDLVLFILVYCSAVRYNDRTFLYNKDDSDTHSDIVVDF